jgi:hypothetical protein
MNIFELARLELEREGKTEEKNAGLLLLDRAITIRKWLDLQERNRNVAQARYKR